MVKVMAAATVILFLMLQAVRADGAATLEDTMRKHPDRFRVMAESVIAGFGGP